MHETTKRNPAVMTNRQQTRSRYQHFKTLLVCFHEGGHTVMGHVLGWRIAWAKVGPRLNGVAFQSEPLDLPLTARTKHESSHRIAALRRALTVFSAGNVAATIHQQAVDERGFSCRDEARAYRVNRQARISDVYPSLASADPKTDYHRVVACAEDIVEGRLCASEMFPILRCLPFNFIAAQAPLPEDLQDRDAAILAEIKRAEGRAELIIKRHWKAVCAIARALHRSKAGHLGRAQLLRLLNDHGVEARS